MNQLKFTKLLFSVIFISITYIFASQSDQTEILFISNVNAAVKNCGCGNPSLGGLARIITIVKDRRRENPNLILIDGGDFLNTYPFLSLNNTVIEMYKELKPDILIFGDQEFIEGVSFFTKHIQVFNKNLLHTNVQYTSGETTSSVSSNIYTRNRLAFLSYLDPGAFDLINKPSEINLSEYNFDQLYKDNLGKPIYLVGIFHGPEENLNEFIKVYPKFDLLLLSHPQSDSKQLNTKPAIIGGGSDGQNIKRITIKQDADESFIQIEDIPVTLDIVPDTTAIQIIKKWGIK